MPIAINGSGTITGLSTGGLPDGSVDADTLASSAVTEAKLASSAVTAAKLASNAVTTAKISDSQVTEAKLADAAKSGIAKAWINFDGTAASIGTGRDSYNVSSVTDNGAGNYTVNLTTATANANSSVVASSIRLLSSTGEVGRETGAYQTSTSAVQVYTYNSASGLNDHEVISIAVFGD